MQASPLPHFISQVPVSFAELRHPRWLMRMPLCHPAAAPPQGSVSQPDSPAVGKQGSRVGGTKLLKENSPSHLGLSCVPSLLSSCKRRHAFFQGAMDFKQSFIKVALCVIPQRTVPHVPVPSQTRQYCQKQCSKPQGKKVRSLLSL